MDCKRDRTNLDDCIVLDCINSNGSYQFSAQNYRHKGRALEQRPLMLEMDRTLQNGRMLELEIQRDRLEPAAEALPQEDCKEKLEVMVLHTEVPQGRTCAEQRVG
eukprot:15163354-Heterocapsa_arctica.AAC.1